MASIPSSLMRLFEPIEDLLADPSVRRVMVDGPDRVFVEREGRLERVDAAYGADALKQSLRGLARRAGKSFDADRPVLEAMLKDGTRFLALRTPVVADGPVLCITRPTGRAVEMAEVVGRDRMLPAPAADALLAALRAGLNIAVIGAPGSGRQRLVEALCSALPTAARVAVVDEGAGLALPGRKPIRLKPRKAEDDARAVSGGDLLYCAGRLGVDRVVVVELRLADAWDAVSLLASRAAPVLMAMPGVSAADGIARLDGLARASTSSQRARGVTALVGSGLDVVVALATRNRRQRVVSIETVRPGAEGPVCEPLFALDGDRLRATDGARHRVATWAEESAPTASPPRPLPIPVPEAPADSIQLPEFDESMGNTGLLSLAGMLPDEEASQEVPPPDDGSEDMPFEVDVQLSSLVPQDPPVPAVVLPLPELVLPAAPESVDSTSSGDLDAADELPDDSFAPSLEEVAASIDAQADALGDEDDGIEAASEPPEAVEPESGRETQVVDNEAPAEAPPAAHDAAAPAAVEVAAEDVAPEDDAAAGEVAEGGAAEAAGLAAESVEISIEPSSSASIAAGLAATQALEALDISGLDISTQAERPTPAKLPGEEEPTAQDLEDSVDPLRMLMQSLKAAPAGAPAVHDPVEEEVEALSVDIDLDDDDDEDVTVITEIGVDIAQEILSKKTFSQVLRSIGTVDDEDDWDASSSSNPAPVKKDARGATSEMDSPLEAAQRSDRNTVVHDDD